MDLISAVRTQQPVHQTSPHPAADRAESASAPNSVRPVADTIRREAVQALSAGPGPATLRLAERDEGNHPAADARAAAMAARDAYIQASIAAGISPLPMP